MKDFRGPLPLTDADFARIRADVMERVRPRHTTAFAFRWAFAMLAAAFVGIVSYKSLEEVSVTMTHVERRASARRIEPTARRAEARRSTEPAIVTSLPASPPRRARVRTVVQPREEPQVRMEIQTSDPDIRIIWLPNQYDPKSEEHS